MTDREKMDGWINGRISQMDERGMDGGVMNGQLDGVFGWLDRL